MYSGIGGDPEEVPRRFLHRCLQPGNAEFGFRAVELKAAGMVIGQVHLEPHVLDPVSIPEQTSTPFHTIEVELAFAFGKSYWGQGLASGACQPMIGYAFRELKLAGLVGGGVRGNHRSLKLQERLGFTLEPDPADADFMSTVLVNQLLNA